jgi:hypothetical protein
LHQLFWDFPHHSKTAGVWVLGKVECRDSVIGSRGRRMCLINCSVGSFFEANEIRMTLFLVFPGLCDVLSSPMARFRETPQI